MNFWKGEASRPVERSRPGAAEQQPGGSYLLRPFHERIFSGLAVANDVIRRRRADLVSNDTDSVRIKSRY